MLLLSSVSAILEFFLLLLVPGVVGIDEVRAVGNEGLIRVINFQPGRSVEAERLQVIGT